MEVVSSDGSVTQIEPGQTRELGRADGLNSSDKTISRRQISFLVPPLPQNKEGRVQFEILGRNPVYISKGDEVKIFRRSEKGEMENGDMFCVSAKNPVWYTLRKIENGGESVRQNDLESVLAQNLESGFAFKDVEDLQQECADISDIDPAKEFGFVVIGHEFDSYPHKIIRDIKNWDWFLDESEKDSGDDDEEDNGKKRKASRRSRKRKRGTGNDDDDDDEWTGESEDEKVLINKSKNDKKPKYVTRSKDCGKRSKKDTIKSKSVLGSKTQEVEDEDDDDAEDDETLGGFIVDDENLEDEEEEIGDEDEEEEEEEEELVDEDDVDE